MNLFDDTAVTTAHEYSVKGREALIELIDEEFNRAGAGNSELEFFLFHHSYKTVVNLKKIEGLINIWINDESIYERASCGKKTIEIIVDSLIRKIS